MKRRLAATLRRWADRLDPQSVRGIWMAPSQTMHAVPSEYGYPDDADVVWDEL